MSIRRDQDGGTSCSTKNTRAVRYPSVRHPSAPQPLRRGMRRRRRRRLTRCSSPSSPASPVPGRTDSGASVSIPRASDSFKSMTAAASLCKHRVAQHAGSGTAAAAERLSAPQRSTFHLAVLKEDELPEHWVRQPPVELCRRQVVLRHTKSGGSGSSGF